MPRTCSRLGVLVVGNGSARRSERAPGHLDHRAAGFDDALRPAWQHGDTEVLAGLDRGLGRELWAASTASPSSPGCWPPEPGQVDYDDDPLGVAVLGGERWTCDS